MLDVILRQERKIHGVHVHPWDPLGSSLVGKKCCYNVYHNLQSDSTFYTLLRLNIDNRNRQSYICTNFRIIIWFCMQYQIQGAKNKQYNYEMHEHGHTQIIYGEDCRVDRDKFDETSEKHQQKRVERCEKVFFEPQEQRQGR